MPHQFITSEKLAGGRIARITLDRAAKRNAQNRGLLLELGEALEEAERDDDVRVVILAANGPIFSAGHDIGTAEFRAEIAPGPGQHPTWQGYGATRSGAEQRMLQEWHFFFRNTRRWRDLRKITIAQVHGSVISAGLMLMWCCDLIVAAEGTVFADVVGTRLGMCGLEYFGHPWEFGPRKAKELLLTGDSIGAAEAASLGMVSKIFPAESLADDTLTFAARVAARPTMAALLIKESVNQAVDCMGFPNALNAAFAMHQLNHAHWAEVTQGAADLGTPEFGVPDWREAGAITPSELTRP